MNEIVLCKTVVKTILLCLLMLCGLGCSKKQGQTPKAPSSAKSQTEKSSQQVSPAQTASKPDSNASRLPRTPADANRAASFRQALEKQVAHSFRDRKKTSRPSGPNESAPSEQVAELTKSRLASTLDKYGSLTDSDEKIDFITEFSDAHPESVMAIADKALDDKDVDVRSAAMEALIDYDSNGPEVLPVAAKALKDSEEQVRQSAVQACAGVDDPQVGKLLLQALDDPSEEVRSAAIQVAEQKDPPVRLEVLKAAVTSSYEDVKTGAVSSLIDMSSPEAVDALIPGLKDSNPDFREEVSSALNFLVSQEFETYDQAKSWWDKNRNKFDSDLSEKDAQ
jgi:hypothetical protein